jgi:autotransporter passenger strand-loop-strand repeat protein
VTVGVVTLAGLTFNGGPDSDGDQFAIGNIVGWDGPGVEQTGMERPLSDGAVIGRGRRTSRALVLEGHASGSTIADGFRARRKLAVALDTIITADGTLTVDEGGTVYGITVRLADQPDTAQAGPYAIEFAISLIAANPAITVVGS